jgi:hypothetical protein
VILPSIATLRYDARGMCPERAAEQGRSTPNALHEPSKAGGLCPSAFAVQGDSWCMIRASLTGCLPLM